MRDTINIGNKEVKLGDPVAFKCDIEQYGILRKIEQVPHQRHIYILTLENEYGFSGEYIGGDTTTTQFADRCWVD